MNEPRINMNNNDVRLSQHFKLTEFLNLRKYPQNIPPLHPGRLLQMIPKNDILSHKLS